MKIKIFQINLGRDTLKQVFRGFSDVKNNIDCSAYDVVFDGFVECVTLEEIFQKFNIERPKGFFGRSMSVSDIVEIVESDEVSPGFYYCDNIGWKKIPEFDKSQCCNKIAKRLQVLFVQPKKMACVKEIYADCDSLCKALDCQTYEATYPFEDEVALLCDEESKSAGKELNRALVDDNDEMYDIVCGDFIITGIDNENACFRSLTEEEVNKMMRIFQMPHRFFKINGKLEYLAYNPGI